MKNKKTKRLPEEDRKLVSDIIFKVLAKNVEVRKALTLFPRDCSDPSVKAVWHALLHFEADEDVRSRDADYSKEQDEYLEMIGFILRDGKPLPQNIIESYIQYHEDAILPHSNDFVSLLKSLFRLTI